MSAIAAAEVLTSAVAPATVVAETVGSTAALAGTATEAGMAAGTALETAQAAGALGIEAGQVSPAVENAVTSLQQGVENGNPEAVMNSFVEAKSPVPNAAETQVGTDVIPEGQTPEQTPNQPETEQAGSSESTEQPNGEQNTPIETLPTDQEAIDLAVRNDLNAWDKENVAPNQKTDPEGFNKWCRDRVEAQQKFTINAQVNNELNKWETQNPRPENQNSEEFNKWVKDRTEKEKELREKFDPKDESKDKEKNEEEKDEKRKLTEADLEKKRARLQELGRQKKILETNINLLKSKPSRTEPEESNLKLSESQLVTVNDEILKLNEELTREILKNPKVVATTLIAITLFIGALSAANQKS